jgi:glutamate-1-semialdehyde 2,1-aminomutase
MAISFDDQMSDYDRKLSATFREFLPREIFDIHAHIYQLSDLHVSSTDALNQSPAVRTIAEWKDYQEKLLGVRHIGGLMIGYPTAGCDIESANEVLRSELNNNPHCRGLMMVAPNTSPSHIEAMLASPQIVGFKPYHCFSPNPPTFQASIDSFLPERIWEIAHHRSLIILLHLVKDLALADTENQKLITAMCKKYPRAKLILAHAARGFHAPNTIEGIGALRGLENVWFDTAGVCEPEAVVAILREFGPRKLLWGSDFPVSQFRGKCVTVGNNFVWLDQDNLKWNDLSPACQPTLVGLESLRAIQQATDYCSLNKTDIEDIFRNNALTILNMRNEMKNTTQTLYTHAKSRIPGATQLLSKRPEMLAPDQWPAYFSEAKGCETWDLDGNHYYDMSTNGIGACLLGFRDPDVTRAVTRRIERGSMCTLNPPEEVELADALCEIHPWSSQARFTRSGGEAMTVAVRIARATTDRAKIAICGYHGWHDWYLAANLGESDALRGHLLPGLEPLGVPRQLRGTVFPFKYNDRIAFEEIITNHASDLAAVVMEPCRYQLPEPGFMEMVKEATSKHGIVLIFDEITIGWRLCFGGSHLKIGVNPDIAVFAKALGNGHPIGAIIGTKDAMRGAHDSFISSTYWTESVGPTAALATLQKMKETKVWQHIDTMGRLVMDAWKTLAEKHHLPVTIEQGFPCFAHFKFDHPQANELRTLYTQLMLQQGFLAGSAIYTTLAHTPEIIGLYRDTIDAVFHDIAQIIEKDSIADSLNGPPAHSGFRRLL